LLIATLIVGCGTYENAKETAVAETEPTTPTKTYTPIPIDTSTVTPLPTNTLTPSDTPTETPTETPEPSPTPLTPLEEVIINAVDLNEILGSWSLSTVDQTKKIQDICVEDCVFHMFFMNDLSATLKIILNRYSSSEDAMLYAANKVKENADDPEIMELPKDDSVFVPENTWFSVENGETFTVGTSYNNIYIEMEAFFTIDIDDFKLPTDMLSLFTGFQIYKLEKAGY